MALYSTGLITYLIQDVVKRVGAVDGEADKDQIGFGVGKRPQPVVFLLAGGIPQGKLDNLACGRVDGVGNVVFEYSRYVFLRREVRLVSGTGVAV